MPSSLGTQTRSPASVGEAQTRPSSISLQNSLPLFASKQVSRPLLLAWRKNLPSQTGLGVSERPSSAVQTMFVAVTSPCSAAAGRIAKTLAWSFVT